RDLKALRGTQVTLRARTNRTLKDARLEWEANSPAILGTIVPNDPEVFEVQFVLRDDNKYRLLFNSADAEPGGASVWFNVTAVPDMPPKVEVTKPGKDKLPANGLLELEGKASDDIGVKSILLKGQVVGGAKLKAKPYRGADGLKLESGGHPV